MEWGDEAYLEEEEDLEVLQSDNNADENEQKGASRPPTTKSADSSVHNEEKSVRIKPPRPTLYSFGSISLRRDPVIDSLIESRKFSIIENPYTRLAQVTSQEPRISQLRNTVDIRPSTAEEDNEENERSSNSRNRRKIQIPKTSELDNQGWDDGLPIEPENGKIEFI